MRHLQQCFAPNEASVHDDASHISKIEQPKEILFMDGIDIEGDLNIKKFLG